MSTYEIQAQTSNGTWLTLAALPTREEACVELARLAPSLPTTGAQRIVPCDGVATKINKH